MSDVEHMYGFTWGPMDVYRMAEINGRRVLRIKTEHHELQIAISPKGQNVMVWLDHQKMGLKP
jgi:hypothetical protein